MASDKKLTRLVEEDHRIEREQDSAILALMEHRWTAVHEHGYGIREYARALGHKSHAPVRKYVKGWELWQKQLDADSASTPMDVLVLASMSEDRREATEMVSEVYGVSPGTIDSGGQREHGHTGGSIGGYGYRQEVKRVRADIDEGASRLVEEGIDPVEARERAARVVKDRLARQRQEAELQADRRERDKQAKSRSFRNLEYELMQMRQRGRNALQLARESDLDGDDELVEFIEDAIAKVRHTLELISLAIVGEAKIDWDAELAKLNDD